MGDMEREREGIVRKTREMGGSLSEEREIWEGHSQRNGRYGRVIVRGTGDMGGSYSQRNGRYGRVIVRGTGDLGGS